jgi:hypothetical protein
VARIKQLEDELRSMKLERDHFKELHRQQTPANLQARIDDMNKNNNKARELNFLFI